MKVTPSSQLNSWSRLNMHPKLWKTLDLAHASYSSILWIIKEEIELKKKNLLFTTEVNRHLGLLDRGLLEGNRAGKLF